LRLRRSVYSSRWLTRQVLIRILLGCIFGGVTAAVNHGFGPASEYTSKVFGRDWCWLAAGLLSGVSATRWRRAVRLVAVFLIPAVWFYYAMDVRAGVYGGAGFSVDVLGVVTDVIAYSVFATVASAALGLLITWIRRGGVVGLLASAVPFAFTAWSGWGVYLTTPQEPTAQRVALTTTWVALACGGAVALAHLLRVRLPRRPVGDARHNA
jgi:hypothetical protein